MKRRILAGIGVITLGLITSAIYDSIKSIPIWTTLKDVLYWIWNAIFCAEFTVWQIILGLLVLFIILIILNKLKGDKQSEPAFKSYISENIGGYTWTWSWKWNDTTNSWNINNLNPECPKCKTIMHYDFDYGLDLYKVNCPRCDYYAFKIKPYKDVEAIILDNVRRKRDEQENKKPI